jgi:DNA-binding MarR family transcriptional regulator
MARAGCARLAPAIEHPGDPPTAESDTALDGLIKSLDSAGRESNKVLVRWLLDAELPLLSACVLITLDPEDAPMRSGEVAEAIGISVEDATLALHELRSLGYAREEKRRYLPTEEGLRVHASLTGARRKAIAAFLSALSEEDRRQLTSARTDQGEG